MATIRIRVDKKTGNPTIVDVCGAGKNCQEVTKNFETMLGAAKDASRALTDEYFAENDPEKLKVAEEHE